MFHHFGRTETQFGNGLEGWKVEVFDGAGVVPIYSDDGITPLTANRAVSDALGNFDFYVPEGVYSLRYYDAGGTLRRTEAGVSLTGGTVVFAQDAEPVTNATTAIWFQTAPGSTRARMFVKGG